MLDSKKRAKLKSLATKENAIFQIGKGAINENQVQAMSDALDKRELMKISVLQACDFDASELAKVLELKLKAEVVCVIGNKIVLYRYSKKKGVNHIDL